MSFSIPKKLRIAVTVALLTILIAPASLLLSPTTAHAQLAVPVAEIPSAPAHWTNSVANIFEKLKDFGLDGIAWIAAKLVLQQITASVVSWINGGFNGNPAFINDPGGFFLAIANQAAGAFIFNTNFGFLCSPLRPMQIGIHASLLVKYQGQFATYTNRSCRISEIFRNAQGLLPFLNGNTQVPAAQGWKSWIAVTQIPQNNPYGAYAIADLEMQGRIGAAQSTNKTVTDWGQGFASKINLKGIITTPGTTIKETLHKALGSNQDALAAADELAEMVSAVAGALVNKMISTGLASLSSTAGGQGTYTSRLRDPDAVTEMYAQPNPAWTSVNDQVNQETEDAANQAIADQEVPAFDYGAGFGVPPAQEPKLSLNRAKASQACTGKINTQSAPASAAIDGADATASLAQGNTCPGDPYWWQMDLDKATALDEVDILVNGPKYLLGPWNGQGPYLVLISQTGTRYQFPIADGTSLIQYVLPPAVRLIPIKTVRIESAKQTRGSQNGLSLSEVELFRHLPPLLDAHLVPTTITSTSAISVDLVQGTGVDPWVTATYYPLYSDPQPLPIENITVVVKDSSSTIVQPSSLFHYTLLPNGNSPANYTLEYSATDPDGFKSATTMGSIRVLP